MPPQNLPTEPAPVRTRRTNLHPDVPPPQRFQVRPGNRTSRARLPGPSGRKFPGSSYARRSMSLGMKLYAEHANPRIERLDRLDDSVARAGRRTESGRHIAHGLMMERVRPQRIRPGNPSHERLFGYGYRMRRLARGRDWLWLTERSAYSLGRSWYSVPPKATLISCSPRQMPSTGISRRRARSKQREIVCVANRVDMPQRSGGLRIETGRIDVASSDQHQTVEPFKQTAQAGPYPSSAE